MTNDEWAKFVAATKDCSIGLDADLEWFIKNPPRSWVPRLRFSRETAIQVAIAIVEMVLPEWREKQPNDTVPLRAVEAARTNPSMTNENRQKFTKALAKGCGESRRRTLGYEHRIAEAARAVANAASASTDFATFEAVAEALSKTEEHILYRFAVEAVYGKEAEVRRDMMRRIVEGI